MRCHVRRVAQDEGRKDNAPIVMSVDSGECLARKIACVTPTRTECHEQRLRTAGELGSLPGRQRLNPFAGLIACEYFAPREADTARPAMLGAVNLDKDRDYPSDGFRCLRRQFDHRRATVTEARASGGG